MGQRSAHQAMLLFTFPNRVNCIAKFSKDLNRQSVIAQQAYSYLTMGQ